MTAARQELITFGGDCYISTYLCAPVQRASSLQVPGNDKTIIVHDLPLLVEGTYETDLTLGDLKRVGEAFQRVLAHIYHRRIDYPGFDFDKKEKRQGAEVVADAQTETADPAPPPAGAVEREGDEEVEIDEREIAG